MGAKKSLKRVAIGLIVAGVLALNANAQAITIDAGIFGSTPGSLGTAGNPVVLTVNPAAGLFLDTINFDLGANTHFNMTSSAITNITFFGSSIFENLGDTEVVAASANHFSLFLPNLGLDRDYHLHPQGLAGVGAAYTLSLWGSTAPVPVPAAAWLFGTGLAAMVGLARRKMNAVA